MREKQSKKDALDAIFNGLPDYELKHRSVRSGLVTVGSQFAKLMSQTVGTAILARILLPQEFGLVAMVVAITNLALFIGDLGLVSAIVQRKKITHGQANAMFWINGAFGMLLGSILIAIAPVVAHFYKEPRLTAIVIAYSATFVLSGFSVQQFALLRRQMRFTAIALIEVASMAGGIVLAICLAFMGWKYWALVCQTLFQSLSTMILVWCVSPWSPTRPKWDQEIPAMVTFGGHLTGSNLLAYFSMNLDNVLVGNVVGATALGFYSKAYNLLMLPIRQINGPMTAVALPALSQLQNNPSRFRSYILNLTSIAAIISVPLVLFTIVDSDNIVLLLLGKNWLPTAQIFRNLGLAALTMAVNFLPGLLLVSTARTKLQLKLSLWTAIVVIVGFCVGILWGSNGVAISFSITNTVMFGVKLYVACQGSSVCFVDILKCLSLPLISGCISAIVLYWVEMQGLFGFDLLVVDIMSNLVFYIIVFFMALGVSKQGRRDIQRLLSLRHTFVSRA